MSDAISITGLVLETRIGVTDEERAQPQEIVIDVKMLANLSRAADSDDLSDTIDYDGLVTEIASLVRTSECNLLEHLGAQIADLVSAKMGVDGVTVSVMKRHVPVSEEVSSIRVEIERGSLG